MHQPSLGELRRIAAAWLASPAGRRVAAVLALALAGQAAFAYYEVAMLGLPPIREEPASFSGRHVAQSLFALVVAASLVAALVAARARDCALEERDLGRAGRRAALAALAAAAAAAFLFLASPAAFHFLAQEDRALEWVSALLLLAAAGLFAADFAKRLLAGRGRRRSWINLVVAAGFAALLFVVGMEEISWMQRVFGFATPEALAEANWQGEFNLHNVQTDLAETLYYVGAGLFLILLPLLRDVVPAAASSHPLFDFVPGRGVAAVAAPAAIFTYGHWNLLPIQLCSLLTIFALLVWARAAAARGDRAERLFFLLAAATVAAGQALFLALGPAMVDLPDATEYKELFIALGLAWYALTATRPRRADAGADEPKADANPGLPPVRKY